MPLRTRMPEWELRLCFLFMNRLFVCLLLCVVGPVRAQPVDSTVTPTSVPPAAAAAHEAGSFAPPDSTPVPGGVAVDRTNWSLSPTPLILPVVAPVFEVTDLLGRTPGSFLYDLGAPGWPHGWSPDGTDPAKVGLQALHTNWNDPLTGRPRLDLLPFEFFEPLALGGGPYGAPVAVTGRLRSFDAPRPVTELRYRRGAGSLQAITAAHAQRRRVSLFGAETTLRVTGGYGGRASQGEYPGSRLRRERRVLTRLVLERPDWHVDLINLHSRHQVGAHAGVLPLPGGGPASVYERFGARVMNERATRRSIRNDFVAEVRLPLRVVGGQPVVRGTWTAQQFRFRDPGDTLRVESDRKGLQLLQTVHVGRLSPTAEFRIETDRARMTWHEARHRRIDLHASVRDTLQFHRIRLLLGAGLHRRVGYEPAADVGVWYAAGGFAVFLRGGHGPTSSALIHTFGLGPLIEPLESVVASRLSVVRGGISIGRDQATFGLSGFANQASHPTLVMPVRGDTARVVQSEVPIRRVGLIMEAGLRALSARGFYLSADGTVTRELEHPDAGDEQSLPTLFGRGRAGMRYALFRGDLDLHLFAEVRAWSAFESLAFHAPSGLLIQPEVGSQRLGPASTLGLFIEAGVREATVYLAWENVLAGTALMHGTMLVPVYPLPEQAFRFGVYWPIAD